MARLTRDAAILFGLESTYGTDPTLTGSAAVLFVSNFQPPRLVSSNVDRDLVRPYLGGSEQLLGSAYKEVSFDVELVGSGTAGAAPAWGKLLQACGFAETVIADTRVDYLPITNSVPSATIYCHDSGVKHRMLGCRGEWSISARVGEVPRISFRFVGIDGDISTASQPTVDVSTWQTPQVITNAFTPSMIIGGTVAATGAPAISGGTDLISTGLTLASGNQVTYSDLINLESVDITAREVSGSLEVDQTASQEVTRYGQVKLNTLSSLSMLHGTVAGKKVLLHMPSVQWINPAAGDVNGRRTQTYDMRCVPNPAGSGNDELRIVTSF